MVLSI
ncbi:Protein of unknown function [Lactobacillus helveticus CIRM-BIA 101]